MEAWNESLGKLVGIFLPFKMYPTLLFRLLLIPYVIFLFPEFFLSPILENISVGLYSRLITFLGIYVGFASGLTYLLGWTAPIKLRKDEETVSVLSTSLSVISIFSIVFMLIFFR
jgi:hypothetical protein